MGAFGCSQVESSSLHLPDPDQKANLRNSFPRLWAIGNLDILGKPLLALLCSTRCSGKAIVQAYDVARTLRDRGVPVIGGFHTSMEKECLDLLLRGKQPVVVCPARSIRAMRIPGTLKVPLAEGRLLVLSPLDPRYRRPTAELAERRNQFVAQVAHSILVLYAAPASKTEALCLDLLKEGKPVHVLKEDANPKLMAGGARGTVVDAVGMILGDHRSPSRT